MKRLPKSNVLLVTLVAGLVLLVLGGAALIAAYFFLSRQPQTSFAWTSPPDMVRVDLIAPDLAVLPLAGEPDSRVIDAALNVGEVETAYATLAYSVLTPDSRRSGHWLMLAGEYQAADPARAAIGYQTAMDLAALSPTLNDVARVELSLQAAQGYQALRNAEVARLAVAQGQGIARYSLSLLPAQRHAALEQVVRGYQRVGAAQDASALQADMELASAGPGVKVEPGVEVLPDLRGSIVLPAAVTSAMQSRQQAAATLAARWLSSTSPRRTTLSQARGQALQAEDAARSAFYAQAGQYSTPDQLAMLYDRVAWLTIKYRASRQGYGTSLVPDWESQSASIRTELAAVYTDLINAYGKRLDTLGQGEALMGRVELLRQGLLWSRLGLFPDHAEQLLGSQLIQAMQDLRTRRGGAGLLLAQREVHGQRLYLLSGTSAGQTAVTPAPTVAASATK